MTAVQRTGGGPGTPGGPATGRRRLSVRTELEGLFSALDSQSGRSSTGLLDRLTGREQLWWRCCQEAVREDPGWLFQDQAERWRKWINGHTPDGGSAGRNPADPPYLVARALTSPFGVDQALLKSLAKAWDESALLPSGPPPGDFPNHAVPNTSEHVRRRLGLLFDPAGPLTTGPDAVSRPAQVMVGLTALLLAGAKPRRHPIVRVSVVFDRADYGTDGREEGTAGVLELQEMPAGPVGLFPDPQAMAGAGSTGQSFVDSLSYAWSASPWQDKGRCVLWRLVLSDRPTLIPRIGGGSLGAAFALGLRELFRHPVSRRPSMARLGGMVYGLRRKTAVTGCIDESARLRRVDGLGAKLQTAHRKRWRLIVPKENEREISNPPDTVKFAATLKQADRYARQWRTGRLITGSVVLAVAAATGAIVSNIDATAANRKHTAARLADVSGTLLNNNVGLAQLFATTAYHYDATPQTRAALFQAVSASPHLVRSLAVGDAVSATATSPDGHVVAAGTENGSVVTWMLSDDLKNAQRTQAVKLGGAVKMIRLDADGHTGAAIDGRTVRIWPATANAAAFRVPAGQRPTAVAISPSGRFIAMSTEAESHDSPPQLLLLDLTTGRTRRISVQGMDVSPQSISVPDDEQIVLLDGAYGTWERRTMELRRTEGSTVGFGTHDFGSALSANGEYFTYSNADTWLPLWRSSGSPDLQKPTLVAETHGGIPSALALSADGSYAAQAVNTTIYVSTSTRPDQRRATPVELTGAGPITANSLAFLGTGGDRLLSASGDMLTLWDLKQISRIGAASDAVIPISCDACPGPWIGLQPGGRHVAVVDGNGVGLDVQELGRQIASRQTVKAPPPGPLSPPLWTADGTKIILVSSDDDSAQIRALAPGLPTVGSWPAQTAPGSPDDPPALLRLTPDRQRVVEMTASGSVEIRDLTSGRILRKVRGPADMAPSSDGKALLPQGYVAVDSTATHAAVIDFNLETGIIAIVTDLTNGRAQVIRGVKPTGVAFIGNTLLIQRSNGILELWDASGSKHLRDLQGATDSAIGPVVNGRDTIAETDGNGTGKLIDYPSGYLLGTLPIPKGYKFSSISLEFSPDSQELVTATEGTGTGASNLDVGEIVDWQINPKVWMRTACDSAGHNITVDEWKQYMNTATPSDLRCPR